MRKVLGDRATVAADPGQERVTGLGVLDGDTEDGVQRLGAVVAQQRQPGADGARDGGGQQACARERGRDPGAGRLDRRAGGGGPLTGHRTVAASAVPATGEEDRDLATRAVEVRLDDLEHEAGGDGGVERVAPASRTAMPAAEASQWVEATIPKVPAARAGW